MGSRGDCRKRVSNKDRDDTARKLEVIERGIAKLKILPLPYIRSEKTMTLKSDQKHEEVIVLADEKVNVTAMTCDETFELSFEEVISEKGPALICNGTTPDPEFTGEGGESENFLNLSMESIFAFSDDEESHDSGSIVFPEDEEESINLARVSTELVSNVIDEEGAAQSDNKIKSQLQTTTMYPKKDAKENDNAESTSATIGMKNAPNPMNAVENIEDFARMLSNSFKNISGGVRRVNAKFQSELMGSFAYQCADILYDDDVTENSFDFTDSFVFTESCDDSSTLTSSVNYDWHFDCHGNVADFPFDEISIESTHSTERSAAFAQNNENGRVSDGNGNADSNAVIHGDDSIRDKDSLNKKVLTKDENASLNVLGNGILQAKYDNAILNEDCRVSDYGCLGEEVSDKDFGQLLQDRIHVKQLNFDLRKAKAVRSKSKFELFKHLKERKNKANQKRRKKLSEETKMAIEMMLAAKGANGESMETGDRNTEKDKSGKNDLEKLSSEATLVDEDAHGKRTETGATSVRKFRSDDRFNNSFTEPLSWRKETKAVACPLRCNKEDADAAPFEDQESYADSTTMLESTLLPKENDPSSPGHIVPDWGLALSQVEEDGICADDDDPSHNIKAPNFVGEQKNVRLDMTGGSAKSSIEAVHETGDEAEHSKVVDILVDIVQVAGDSIKILETKPLWKTAVDPNTGRSYYYNRLTRKTTWTTPLDFAER